MVIKKRKRKHRKNPKYVDAILIDLLASSIVNGSPQDYADTLKYYNQGEKCKDCDQLYEWCKCEYCNECGQDRCLCNLNLNNDMSLKDRNKITREARRFAESILDENQIKHLEISIKHYKDLYR